VLFNEDDFFDGKQIDFDQRLLTSTFTRYAFLRRPINYQTRSFSRKMTTASPNQAEFDEDRFKGFNELVFMKTPPGFKEQGKVCRCTSGPWFRQAK
jgi:hypothetical protein